MGRGEPESLNDEDEVLGYELQTVVSRCFTGESYADVLEEASQFLASEEDVFILAISMRELEDIDGDDINKIELTLHYETI